MPIAVPYARVSDRRQAETLSIPTQLDYIRRWCELEELELGPAFVDAGESAKTADRTQLQRLLAYCRAHRSDVACVVVFRLDRWTRELRDYLVLSEELARLGIPLRSRATSSRWSHRTPGAASSSPSPAACAPRARAGAITRTSPFAASAAAAPVPRP